MAAAACLLLLLGAPLWLGWYEPGLFIYLNHSAAALPPPLWAGLSLLGNGWGLLALTSPLLVLAPRLMWAWLFAAPFAALLSRGIKVWLDSPRPAAVLSRDRFDLMGGDACHLQNLLHDFFLGLPNFECVVLNPAWLC
jgi:hypothetical protein